MSKRIGIPKSAHGFGYVGTWRNGKLGWCGVSHVTGWSRRTPDGPSEAWEKYALPGDVAYLCRVTVTPVRDRLGRPITKRKARGEAR